MFSMKNEVIFSFFGMKQIRKEGNSFCIRTIIHIMDLLSVKIYIECKVISKGFFNCRDFQRRRIVLIYDLKAGNIFSSFGSKKDMGTSHTREKKLNPLRDNPTKWSNTLKQFVGNLPTNCLSVFDHFVKLALKGLI